MKYIFFLSGENIDVARSEIIHLFKDSKILGTDGQIALVELGTDAPDKFDRLALSHEVWEFLGSSSLHNIQELFEALKISSKKVCVRVEKAAGVEVNSASVERRMGEILWQRGAKISVSSPEVIIKVYISSKAHLGILVHSRNKKQFLERQPDLKPYFRPGVILPKFARALVNISGIERGEILLDPMCGAGTILTEAGLMGIDFVGVEAYEDIARGCAVNLSHYGLPLNVMTGDVKTLPFKDESFHAVITDFPYLKSSKSFGPIDSLYTLSLEELRRVLVSGRKAVIISNMDIDEQLTAHFKMEEKFSQRVHGSMVRRFYLCV